MNPIYQFLTTVDPYAFLLAICFAASGAAGILILTYLSNGGSKIKHRRRQQNRKS